MDRLTLQDDLSKLNDWPKQCLLIFDIDKCKTVHISIRKQVSQFAYKMTSGIDEYILQEISEEKDLGVWISNNSVHSLSKSHEGS